MADLPFPPARGAEPAGSRLRDRDLAVVVALFYSGAALFVGVVLGRARPVWQTLFAEELSPISWATSTLLAMTAAVAVANALKARHVWAHAGLAAICLLGAVDERFMGHERLGEMILFSLFDGDVEAMGAWGDLPLLLYLIAGGAVLWPLLRQPTHRWLRPLWGTAIALVASAVFMDIVLPLRPWHSIEEVVEVFAAVSLLVGSLAAAAGRAQDEARLLSDRTLDR